MVDSARAQPAEDDTRGVAFPYVGGSRSTTETGRAVFTDAARAVDPALAGQISRERDWRNNYLGHARRLLETSLATPHTPCALAEAGLQSLHERFEFVHDGGAMPLREAIGAADAADLDAVVVQGVAQRQLPDLSVPYRGDRLQGDGLHRKLDQWLEAGVVEPSFAESIRMVMAHRDWLDLSGHSVIVLGAGAEMGPLHSLSRWGATVVPLDLQRPEIWERILRTVRQGSGKAIVPLRKTVPRDAGDDLIAAAAGVDLVTDMPAVARWLADLDGPVTVGNYVYADGSTHVRVSMAVDAVTAYLLDRRDDLSLAVLATPTDVFAVPADTVGWSRRRFGEQGITAVIKGITRSLTGNRLFAPNYADMITTPEGLQVGVADCLVKQQGPNYALAKRLQRWRARLARRDGITTSINVAPPTRTRSVLRNRALAAAYAGANRFGVEVFDPSTSNTLMAAMLVHDLRNPKSVANPETPLEHPHALFWHGANHGGLWRNPYSARSVLGLAVVLGMVPRGA
ncbi:MAG: hypothetical protein GEU74_04065 [Nitriliruptorales bacterium]|nr:hypothetical protein [Nitriliruptorales bacterium]